MAPKYLGCTTTRYMPYVFSDLGFFAGVPDDFAFDDIEPVVAARKTAPVSLPFCHAVVLATSKRPASKFPGRRFNGYDMDIGLITFAPEMQHIPDVYAFLHTVLNTNGVSAMKPGSTLERLQAACRRAQQPQRGTILKQSKTLRNAHIEAVRNGIWKKAEDEALEKEAAATAAPASGSPSSAALPHDVPVFFVFVQSPVTGAVFMIDEGSLYYVSQPGEPGDKRHGALTDDVIAAVNYLKHQAGEDAQSTVFALTARSS